MDKRKNLRRTVTYPALLDAGDGTPLREATLCDVSEEGAQLLFADSESVPDDFVLVLTSDGAATRRCRVVWRTSNQVGVQFVTIPKPVRQFAPRFAFPPSPIPVMAETAQAETAQAETAQAETAGAETAGAETAAEASDAFDIATQSSGVSR